MTTMTAADDRKDAGEAKATAPVIVLAASETALDVVVDAAAESSQSPETAGESDHGMKAPAAEEEKEITLLSSLHSLFFSILWFNIASIVFVPLGILAHFLQWGDILIFVFNFLAIIPLAKMLDFATDQLAMRLGETIGGLLNASFGNAVELIVGILALKNNLVTIVQASLIGSMLSNMLLVLGFCFFLGGLVPYQKNRYLRFDVDRASTRCGMLAIVVLGFLVPAALDKATEKKANLSEASHGIAIVLLITYVAYLTFNLKTNPDGLLHLRPLSSKRPSIQNRNLTHNDTTADDDNDDDEERPTTWIIVAIIALVGVTVLIGVCAEFLVDSLEGLSVKANISETFIGLIILPIVGNAAEHVTAVSSAMRNKVDLALEVALGSSMQIALLVTPFLVLVGWGINVNLTLDFDTFQTAVLFVSIFVVNSIIADGKSHWLEGWMLLASYAVIAIAFWYF